MKNAQVQDRLNQSSRRFENVRKFKPGAFLNEVVGAMNDVGGITGFRVASGQTMTIHNHAASYTLPVRYEEHSAKQSALGKKAYLFLEGFMDYLQGQGVSKRAMEYHLGRDYSSKHHAPK